MTERRSKYGIRTDAAGKAARTVNGILFASKREADRYRTLWIMERTGAITDLEVQPSYDLVVNGVLVCRYRPDFRYLDTETGQVVVEDSKGVRTPLYVTKRRLMQALYGIDVRET